MRCCSAPPSPAAPCSWRHLCMNCCRVCLDDPGFGVSGHICLCQSIPILLSSWRGGGRICSFTKKKASPQASPLNSFTPWGPGSARSRSIGPYQVLTVWEDNSTRNFVCSSNGRLYYRATMPYQARLIIKWWDMTSGELQHNFYMPGIVVQGQKAKEFPSEEQTILHLNHLFCLFFCSL